MMSTLLAAKLHRPSPRSRRVERPHLIARLDEGLQIGLHITLVSAPAGFGKTTCISEWADTLTLPVAWLSLDPSDDEPGKFFAYLVAALRQVDPDISQEIEGALRSGQLPPADIICTSLVNAIMRWRRRSVLILDDFQVIQDRYILQVVEKLVDHLPEPLHLVLVTREDPPLPLARLRGNNQLTEIRAGDLRFSGREAGRFLNDVMALSLSKSDVAVLEDRTEGWVVGLQLAGFSIRGRADPSAFIANLSGSHRHILSYLTEEVLGRQPDDIQQFLLQTSFLSRLSGDLCNAVTGRADCHALLEQLLGANLFLISLDDEGHWYRYHHLFADLLMNQLRQTLPADSIQELHRRASQWLAENDQLDEAVRHALAGQDFAGAASLVERMASSLMFAGRIEVLKRWLEFLPDESFRSRPRLAIYRLWIDLLQGSCAPQAVQETEQMLNALPPSPDKDHLRAELMVILCRFVAFSGDTPRAIALAEEALIHLPGDALALRARAHSTLVVAYGLEGRVEKTDLAYRECLAQALASGNFSLAAHTTMSMAVGQAYYGRLREAARLSQSIIDMGEQAGQKVFYPAGQGYVGLANIYLEWNDLVSAERCAMQGIDLCRQGGLDGVFPGSLTLARLRQAQGDFEGALGLLGPLEPVSRSLHDITLPIRQIRLRLAMDDLEGALPWTAPLQAMLDAGQAEVHIPLLLAELVELALARMALAQDIPERARHLLDQLLATAEPGGRTGLLLEACLLQALSLLTLHQEHAAVEVFERALALAEPEGYMLLFLEEGQAVIPLLTAVARRPDAPDHLRHYAQRLLDTFPAGKIDPASQIHASSGLIEPLTAREQEVLALIAAGDSNQAIANRLVITVSAVKKHTGNIFGKLEVTSRTQAVARAHELGLLAAYR